MLWRPFSLLCLILAELQRSIEDGIFLKKFIMLSTHGLKGKANTNNTIHIWNSIGQDLQIGNLSSFIIELQILVSIAIFIQERITLL